MRTSTDPSVVLAFFVAVALTNASFGAPRDASPSALDNWHQWRGPLANGSAPRGDPPLAWDQQRNIKWKVEIPGVGSSTPIVWDDRVFLLTAIRTDRVDESVPPADQQPDRPFGIKFPRHVYQFAVMSLRRADGKIEWQRVVHEGLPHEGHHPDNDFASSSPTTDGKRLYVSFGSRGIYCLGLDGETKWSRRLGEMKTRLSFGEGTSPTLHEDSLIVNWDHDGPSRIFVLDAHSGDTRWQKDRDEMSAWSTPLVVEAAGKTQVVVNGSNRVRSYDLASGDLIWECGGQVKNVTPSPVAHRGLVFCMSGYKGSAVVAMPLDATGDISGTSRIAWQHERGAPYIPSPLLVGDVLYYTQSNSAIVSCVRAATGEPLYGRQRLPGLRKIYASPVAAAGRVYIVDREGTTIVLAAGSEMKVLATNRLDDPIDASPAIVGNELFLRGQRYLYCIAAAPAGS